MVEIENEYKFKLSLKTDYYWINSRHRYLCGLWTETNKSVWKTSGYVQNSLRFVTKCRRGCARGQNQGRGQMKLS